MRYGPGRHKYDGKRNPPGSKIARTGAWFTESELVGWCVLMFVLGAAFAVVLLFSLSTWGM